VSTAEQATYRYVQKLVDLTLDRGTGQQVLDAGCGYNLPLALPTGTRLVGLDISPEALAKHDRLDDAILGDLETYPLPAAEYDLILCWTVLEHLRHPRAAVENLARALKPGGLLVIRVPNVWSLKGLVTKLTPYRFHVWVYRRLFGYPDAGKPGFAPFPTYLRPEIAPRRLEEVGRASDLERIFAANYQTLNELPRALRVIWSAATRLGSIVTLGAWDSAAGEHVSVFRRSQPQA
jgi:SAM-dependent methyltransferase